jgi:hypothetical protein
MNWSDIIYVPQAKWKFGERAAIGRLQPEVANRIVPIFRLPPPGDFDPDLERTVTADLYLKCFGSQLADARGKRPTLLDGSAIEELRNEDTGALFFAELLERGRIAGGLPIPVIGAKNNQAYKEASVAFAKRSTDGSVCFRIDVAELEFIESREALRAMIETYDLRAERCSLLIDAGALDVHDLDQFCGVLANQISRLILAGDWQLVIWSGTTFPETIKLKPGQSASFDRRDWATYRRMKEMMEFFTVLPVFSDYLLENSGNLAPFRATPTAHLRYSSENKYFYFKGKSVRQDQKYRNIIPVAEALVKSGIFKGEQFSKGDAYIQTLTEGPPSAGHAGTWRWCSNDHHIALVTGQIASIHGLEIGRTGSVVEPDQLRLVEILDQTPAVK